MITGENIGLGCLIFSGGTLLIAGLAAIWAICVCHSLTGLRNAVQNHFSRIEMMVKRHCELISNLTLILRIEMQTRTLCLDDLTAARIQTLKHLETAASLAAAEAGVEEIRQAVRLLTETLEAFRLTVENDSALKDNPALPEMLSALAETLKLIVYSQQGYNRVAADYNAERNSFPVFWAAKVFGFEPVALFDSLS